MAVFTGTDGRDIISTGLEDDVVDAGGENDSIRASEGRDVIDGGADRDFVTFTLGDRAKFAAPSAGQGYSFVITDDAVRDTAMRIDTVLKNVENVEIRANRAFQDAYLSYLNIDATAFTGQLNVVFETFASLDIKGGSGHDYFSFNEGSSLSTVRIDGGAGFDVVSHISAATDARIVAVDTVRNEIEYVVGNLRIIARNTEALRLTVGIFDAYSFPIAGLTLIDVAGSGSFVGTRLSDRFVSVTSPVYSEDRWTGNGGADSFIVTYSGRHFGAYIIDDFDGDDTITLGWNGATSLTLAFIGAASFGGIAGQYRAQTGGGQTIIELDIDGDRVADNRIILSNGIALSETATGSNILRSTATIAGFAGGVGTDTFVGTAGADAIRGYEGDDVLGGGAGDDYLAGGPGADIIDGGDGNDVMTGGDGIDRFVFGAGPQGADRITDFAAGFDKIDLGGRAFTAAARSGGSVVLTYEGGTVRIDGNALPSLSFWNDQLVGTPTIPPSMRADQFAMIVAGGGRATVQGTGRVVAGSAGVQQIFLVDAPGRITFGPTFNTGGDQINFRVPASAWTVKRSGSSVELWDGDTMVILPIGVVGTDLVFPDGIRTLRFDTTVVRLGTQVLTTTAAPINAIAENPTVATPPLSGALTQLILLGSDDVVAFGRLTIAGSPTTAETVVVADGAQAFFGPSFNAGGDTIYLPSELSSYQITRSGSTIMFKFRDGLVTMPVSVAGITLKFGDGTQALLYLDEAAGVVKLGTVVIGATSVVPEPVLADWLQNDAVSEMRDPDIAAAPLLPIDFVTGLGLIA